MTAIGFALVVTGLFIYRIGYDAFTRETNRVEGVGLCLFLPGVVLLFIVIVKLLWEYLP